MTSSNYAVAWRTLCERFDNKRLIVRNHIKTICDMPLLKKESHSGLRKLTDIVTINTQ